MGGRGSGRSIGMFVGKCHEYNSVDLAWLERKKLFVVGHWSTVTWSYAGRQTGSIRVEAHRGGARLIYRARQTGEVWQEISEFVPIVETATNFGGRRLWFACLSCRRRCRIIYGGMYFRCRRCHRLKYQSQYECSYSRAANRVHKLRKRLGQAGSLEAPFASKPKGMHWKTYERLEVKDEDLRRRWANGLIDWINKLE